MTETLTKVIINCATGERTRVALTPEEIAQREKDAAAALAEADAIEAARTQREADRASAISKLTALGLTEDEALALVGQ